jgi:hypothetical protein
MQKKSYLSPCPWCGVPLPNYADIDKCTTCGKDIFPGPEGKFFKNESDAELWVRHYKDGEDGDEQEG